MEEGFTRRLVLPDVRGARRYMRVTWHRDTATVVFSHWQDDICVTTTQVSLRDATQLISLMVGALKESAFKPAEVPRPDPAVRAQRLLERLRDRFRPQVAQVIGLPARLGHQRSIGKSKGA